jgi:signal transduction histidine kinase
MAEQEPEVWHKVGGPLRGMIADLRNPVPYLKTISAHPGGQARWTDGSSVTIQLQPFRAKAYRTALRALQDMEVYLDMLCRASLAFPDRLSARDKEVLQVVQAGVERLERSTEEALAEAQRAVQKGGKGPGGALLLSLRRQFIGLEEFLDERVGDYVLQKKREKGDLTVSSAGFILSLSAMMLSVRSVGEGLLTLGHAVREIVE